MKKKIISLMPEFQFIRDESLREKTINIWEQAVHVGGWSLEDLLDMPFTLLILNTKINLITHTRAVTLCALKIATVMIEEYGKKVKIDQDFLLSGALLHDVGKLFEYTRENGRFVKSEQGKLLRHPISGAAFAAKFNVPDEIIHIIAAHSKEGDGARTTVEAVIVNHADFVNFDALKV